ncbi:EscI/YscI/HrpB family type III secretion system inner rod protein [Dickeya lacustris]|uniref:EscI/YscI/HrpB family type III secretion system inner rod protein n=1 Tax=Dickeya lacustris TaxID=2259638 RepID=A0ABY8G8E7_9GAMM|nr:EscI/YscI/HrpB family type III secretion system inner rod protein [Dickeya lacustris]WFN56240.1 EscI/YscI/HrpB family type III secretion system inner rod protein [Dickeya lacustris]
MMKINRVSELQGTIGDGEARSTTVPAQSVPAQSLPAQSDVAWFSAALDPTVAAQSAPVADNKALLGALAEKSDNLENMLQKAERKVGKSINSNNPKDVMDATRTLSSFYLESLLNAKVVAKSVQSLEKLTNLQ